jgi:Flp pilus assembly pilin Flp
MRQIILFLNDEAGATASEYSIMAALIAVVIIISVLFFGEQVRELYEHAKTEMANHGI